MIASAAIAVLNTKLTVRNVQLCFAAEDANEQIFFLCSLHRRSVVNSAVQGFRARIWWYTPALFCPHAWKGRGCHENRGQRFDCFRLPDALSGPLSRSPDRRKLDRISVSFLVESLNRQRGGSAANIVYNLALLKERPDPDGHSRDGFRRIPRLAGTGGRGYVGGPRHSRTCSRRLFSATPTTKTTRSARSITGAMAHSKGYKLAEAVAELPDLLVDFAQRSEGHVGTGRRDAARAACRSSSIPASR